MTVSPQDRTPLLQSLMQQAGFSSFRALSRASGVSERQIRRIRQGAIAGLRLDVLLKLGQALAIAPAELLRLITDDEMGGSGDRASNLPITDLHQEYARLQTQLEQQRQALQQEFQDATIRSLESLLLQWPTAAFAAQQNPQAPAVKLLPLLRPMEQLLQEWGITAISPVGAEVPYDPQQHQLMDGMAEPGEPVRVRYTGYRQQERLLYRAKVSPVAPKSL